MDIRVIKRISKINIYSILVLGALLPLAALLPLCIILAISIIYGKELGVSKAIIKNPLLVMLFLIMIITSAFSELWYISIAFAVLFIVMGVFSVFISVNLEEKDYKTVIQLLLIVGITVAVIGICQGFIEGNEIPKSWIDKSLYTIDFRIYSTFFNPNILAGFLNLIIITGLTVVIYPYDKKITVLGYSSAFIALIAIMLTYSRGGWISLVFALVVASCFERKYFKYTILIVLTLVGFDYFTETGRLVASRIIADSSLIYRLEIWKATIKVIKENIFFGIGSGTLWYILHNYSNSLKWYVTHAHNVYLQILVDTGIIGSIVFILFFKGILDRIKNSIFTQKPTGIISTISFIFYLSMLVFGLVDAIALIHQISLYIWLLIGINLVESK